MDNQDFICTNRGIGKELIDLLRKELSIPEGVMSFEVRFAVNELVTVNCTYAPKTQK